MAQSKNPETVILEVVQEMKVHHFSKELEYFKTNESCPEKVEQLQQLLGIENCEKKLTAHEELSQSLYNATYMKSWKRLNILNKIEKLKEFVDKNFEQKYKKELTKIIDIKTCPDLSKDSVVIYDSKTTKIEKINGLTFNEDLKKYEFIKIKKNIKQQ
jgi:hypothetical protein